MFDAAILNVFGGGLAPKEVTPPSVTDALRDACRKVAECDQPVYVPVVPAGRVQECYLNVGRAVEERGGEIVYGWLIWQEVKGRYLSFIHHAVYRDAAGELSDPTPQADGEQQILFVPDGRRKYEGHLIAGVYVPLVSDPKVAEFCESGNQANLWHERNTRTGEPIKPTEEFVEIGMRQLRAMTALRGPLGTGFNIPVKGVGGIQLPFTLPKSNKVCNRAKKKDKKNRRKRRK